VTNFNEKGDTRKSTKKGRVAREKGTGKGDRQEKGTDLFVGLFKK